MTDFVGRFRKLSTLGFRKPATLEIGGDINAFVIPDLVSEERAESVGNPCRNVGDIIAGAKRPRIHERHRPVTATPSPPPAHAISVEKPHVALQMIGQVPDIQPRLAAAGPRKPRCQP
ncbi:hypothetical protein [Allomesorhizobium camelthorni]|uniref:Uncharacterized protein n=1 Tax=Allomesorhizobium camelthorni TaxID=475069 RepID=A0A6G4WA71_9HYPH|nr:hypothetical protein [Mesorhizobium camelthorni]